MQDETALIYAAVGGDQPFYDLVRAFYAAVETDAVLRPLYPADLTHAKEHLALFFIQRFGGPGGYGEQRGHPRLRMRHVPFRIGEAERDAWLRCIGSALDQTPALAPFRAVLDEYFAQTARFLVNDNSIPTLSVSS